MAINTYRLWMATDANRLLANQNAFIQATAPAFYQGNVAQLELHIVASAGVGTSPVEVPFPAGAAISVAVGDTNTYPTGGTWELMVDTTETQPMPYNATTTQVAAALNALSEVSTAGGVTVSKTGDGYTITWVTYGLKPTIGIGSDTLTPSSYESISLVQTGDANTRQIVFVELRQNPIALGVDWTALPSPSVTVSEVQAWNGTNRIWRVSIDPQPKAGTITIAYGSKTATLAYNASPSTIAAALSPAQVFATGQYQWDIAIAQDSVLTASGSLVGYYGFTGSINFATAECHQFLAGAERKATMLEVSISVDSKRYTLIQTVCNVFADVVSDGVLVPLPLGTAMSEQVANARFVRRDINQYPDGGTQNEIWRNIGLVNKDGTDVVAALSYSSSPSFANPFVTLSDISGLGATWGNITGTLSDQTDLQSALDSKYDATNPSNFIPEANVDGNTYGRLNGQWQTVISTTGGALDANASITASDTSTATDSELAGWGLGVELSADHTKGTTVEFDGLDTYDGLSHMNVNPTGLTFPDATVQTTAGIGDAPSDNQQYTRYNNTWFSLPTYVTPGDLNNYVPKSGGELTGEIYFTNPNPVSVESSSLGWNGLFIYSDQDPAVDPMRVTSSNIQFPDNTIQDTAFPGFAGYATELWVIQRRYAYVDTYNRITFPSGTNPDSSPNPGHLWFQSDKFRYSTSTSSLGNLIASEGWVNSQGYITSSALTPYAQLDGATFTGKVNHTVVGGVAGLNIGVGGTSTASTTAGDMWIATGGASLNYRDGLGTWRVIPNTGSINTFTQPQIIATTLTSTTPALRITNIATAAAAHSLLVEDDANPDSTSFIITNSGNVGIGLATGYTATQKVEVVGNVKADAFINGTGPTYNVKAIQAHSGGSDTHELLVSVNGSTYRVGMRFVSTP
jgi:hypothetical protein